MSESVGDKMADALVALWKRDESELEAMRKDAERYRWLRGDCGPASVRWPRWKVEHWTGQWNPVQGQGMDAAIDAAMESVR